MKRDRHLVSYDIRDPKRLRLVAKTLHAFGTRMQYSVFVCDLSFQELIDMKEELRSILCPEDSVMIVPLGPGYDSSCFEFMGARRDLPSAGPVIV